MHIPFRIISLVPSLTETLCDLGLHTNIIGCTNFCISPKFISKTAKIIGGTKNPDIDLLLSLDPTHVIVNDEENTTNDIQTLYEHARENSFTVIKTFPKTVFDSTKIIEEFGKIFLSEKKAKQWIQAIENEFNKLQEIEKLNLHYIYFIWRNPWMLAGDQSYIAYLLSLIGLNNQIKTSQLLSERYPKLSESMSIDFLKETDLFLFSSEPYPFKVRHISEFFQTHNLGMERFLLVNGQNLSWYGTRTLKALQYLARLKKQILDLKQGGQMTIFKYSLPLLFSLGLFNTSFADNEVKYSVLNCHDGDTCQLKSPDNLKLKIRLIGIDAPEVANRKNKNSQPMGEESKVYINQLIKGKTVTLKNYATDPFGRALAEIYFNKENINIKMVESGMAEVYHGKTVKEFDISPYLTAEKAAKEKKIGIWSLKNYQSPKEFRSSKK